MSYYGFTPQHFQWECDFKELATIGVNEVSKVEDITMKRIILLVAALAFVLVLAGLSSAADELTGTYISRENRSEYITFSPDGKFYLKQKKKAVGSEPPSYDAIEGTYWTDKDSVTLKLPDGGEAVGKFKGGTFMDNERRVWTKEGAEQKPAPGIQPKKRSNY